MKEICAHLTEDEKRQLIEAARRYGEESGSRLGKLMWPVALLTMGLGFVLTMSWPRWPVWIVTATAAFVAMAVFGILISRKQVAAQRQWMREFLCSTQWAREQGFTPETLPLNRWPWSRRETWSGKLRDRVKPPARD